MSSIESFVRAVPKVELHLHLVGSASPSTVIELARRSPDTVVPTSPTELAEWFEFTDFLHFIDVYQQVSALVRTGADVATLVEGSARDLAAQEVRYAEMTVTPATQVVGGVRYEEVVEGLDEGRRRARHLGVELAWIFDIPGGMGGETAEITVDVATRRPPDGLVGFGLGGVEVGVDRRDFGWAFDRARAAGLRSVPHAGEADGPSSILAALDVLGAERIGHGVRCVEDPDLLRRIVDEQVPLEVCPSSNVCTGVVASLDEHPLPELLDVGAFVTINTDDPPMFSTTLVDEYLRIAAAFDLGLDAIAGLVRNGVTASFLDDDRKRTLSAEIDASVAEHQA